MSRTEEQPTVLERPALGGPGKSSGGSGDAGETPAIEEPGSFTSATEALREEEAVRVVSIIRIGRVFGAAILVPLPFIGGDAISRYVFAAALVVSIAVGIWLGRLFRDPTRYSERKMLFLILPTTVATFAGILYWGIFSAGVLFVVLALYFFSRRESLTWALGIYITAAGLQAVLAAIVLGGAAPDPGVFVAPDLPLHMLLLGQVLIQAGYLGALLLGRASYRASVASIEKLQRATQLAVEREALLVEAHQDLDYALQLGGGGRYTGRRFGDYELGDVIGRGGMGEVYEASHVESGADAAVKLLHPQALDDPSHVARFSREVLAASALKSRHATEVFQACDPTDPVPYYVMERLHGQDLAAILRDPQQLTHSGLEKLLHEVGALVDEAGELGIVHRDLTPKNLFLAIADEGESIWKVLDFGVATLSEHSGTLTQGHVIGTPGYMSPEQARGKTADRRADVYALAALAYRWLTKRPAFYGKDIPSLLYQIVYTMPQRPSELAGLSPQVDVALAIGLAKRPDDRFDRATELADAVRSALDDELDPAVLRRGEALMSDHPWAGPD